MRDKDDNEDHKEFDVSNYKACVICDGIIERNDMLSDGQWEKQKYCCRDCRQEAAKQNLAAKKGLKRVATRIEFENVSSPHLTREELIKLKSATLNRFADLDKIAQAQSHKLKTLPDAAFVDQERWMDMLHKALGDMNALVRTLHSQHSFTAPIPKEKEKEKDTGPNTAALDLLSKTKKSAGNKNAN